MVKNGRRAADVIDRIRAMASNSPVRMERTQINGVIDDVITLTRTEMDRHRIELGINLDANLAPVAGDRVQLQQAPSHDRLVPAVPPTR